MYWIASKVIRVRRYLVTVDELITKRVELWNKREQERIVRLLYQQVENSRRQIP